MHLGKVSTSCPIDWRTKKPVIVSASNQWFINIEKLKAAASNEISNVNIYPITTGENSKKLLRNQVETRPYWCISRQRAWGTPIPVFYSKKTGEPISHKGITEFLCSELKTQGNIDFWWTRGVSELIPEKVLKELNMNADDIEKGKVNYFLLNFYYMNSCIKFI